MSVCVLVQFVRLNLLPSSLESHATHMTLCAFINALLSVISIPFDEWKPTEGSLHCTEWEGCAQICIMHARACMCGWWKGRHPSICKGDFHSKQIVEAEV